ncbi:DUF4258 domain-containing protein [Algoriphagus formosus]|uniref:DUF4258 domain-containing protein n=1 Tax=Algoriphagus formosus TaxID=2007308 RepID=UPI000C28E1C9|nr:DUF4258 domain-containing protein [Algoriphagus formosus]
MTIPSTTSMTYSRHSKIRLQQRGIHQEEIQAVLRYGRVIHRQGMKFHYLPKSKSKSLGIQDPGQLSKLMVVTVNGTPLVVTCYKHESAIHRVKKKSKRLLKN